MVKIFALPTLCLFFICHPLLSQQEQLAGSELTARRDSTYRVPANRAIASVIPFEELHLFSNFQRCTIHYTDGTSALTLANYNFLHQTMALINVKKDTLFVKNDYRIKGFDFGPVVFVNDYVHGLVMLKPGSVYPILGKREYFNVIPVDHGTYDGYSNFVDPSLSSVVLRMAGHGSNESSIQEQLERSNIIVEKNVVFFVIDKNDRVHPARSQEFYRIFPKFRSEIKDYIGRESIDFGNEDDLIRLISFCHNLESGAYAGSDGKAE
jgi:hypothetical protein